MNNIYRMKAAVIAIIFVQNLSALSLDDLLPSGLDAEKRQTLETRNYTFRYDENKEGIKMLPLVSLASELRENVNSMEHNLFLEVLTMMPIVGDMSRQDYFLKIYNYILGISAISGTLYTSSAGVNKELFSDVYRVRNVGDRRAIPEMQFRVIPSRWSMKVHMKETNLGRGYYQLTYRYDGQSILLSIVNLTKFQKIFRILNPYGMQLNFLLTPMDNGMMLIYVNCTVKIENEKLVRSLFTPWGYFRNRVNLLYSWIYKGLVGSDAIVPMPES